VYSLVAELSEEDGEGGIIPNLPTKARYIIKARKRREAAESPKSMGIHLIEVLNQILVADEAHTA
jgi:hypothetical protein